MKHEVLTDSVSMPNEGIDRVSVRRVQIMRVDEEGTSTKMDTVACEEPLEILLSYRIKQKKQTHNLTVTMRTPGEDEALVKGFLYAEGLIDGVSVIEGIELDENQVIVELNERVDLDHKKFERNFVSSSSCGLCGKASLEALSLGNCKPVKSDLRITQNVIEQLDAKMRASQGVFSVTGGLHACALFSEDGDLVSIKEDIGRHNALDKLIGEQLSRQDLPLADSILLLSGRVGYEMAQKAVRAGVPVVVAIGAPTSLAVEILESFDVTLIGFLRNGKYNVYTHPERVIP